MNKVIIFFLKAYKMVISPIFPPSCRFEPSCSIYSMEAYKKYGMIKASFLTIKRILRCNPFSKGGYDPVK